MPRLLSLPVFLYRLLCLIGAAVSASAAWVFWLGAHSPTIENLESLARASSALSLPAAAPWLALADLDPAREVQHLNAALAADPRNLTALLRLSLSTEFAGDPAKAQSLLDQATLYHHSYKSYMAALTQASRSQCRDRLTHFASLALRYCPRDADGVYTQFLDLAQARQVLASTEQSRQNDFLRFLLGQRRLADAQSYQANLSSSASVDRYRLELCDLLFWDKQEDAAVALFTKLHPEFVQSGTFNTQLRSRPTSLAFDWRFTQHKTAQMNWRPGELDVKVDHRDAPLELLSLFVAARRHPHTRLTPFWTGDTQGLSWHIAAATPNWNRVSLLAAPGPARRFQLLGVQIE